MKSIVVFCGAAEGINPVYRQQAYHLGTMLAQNNIRLIYGGAQIGIMGAVADGVLQNGGNVTGVIPGFLQTKEIAHPGLTELIVTENMHQRKLIMHELSDGIITLPGGWGTMEEMYEMLTWAQLGLHSKPAGLLNINRFYDHLLAQQQYMVSEGFLKESYASLLQVADTVEELLQKMAAAHAIINPSVLIDEEQT